VVGIADVTRNKEALLLRLNYAQPLQATVAQRGERFLLYQRFTDFNTDKVVRFLESLDGEEGLFLELLQDPETTAGPLSLPKKVAALVAKPSWDQGLTPSQANAFEAICTQRVTAVWGPPGTGKTHFLAATTIALAAAPARAGVPFRVLVTAFTHAAMENLLRKISQLADPKSPLEIGKAKTWQGVAAGIGVVPEDEMAEWLDEHAHAVLGATAYSCLKMKAGLAFMQRLVAAVAAAGEVLEFEGDDVEAQVLRLDKILGNSG
jgi:hypothetical protein